MTSPPTLYQGSRSTGTHMPIESDIVIEKQAITFDISEFPKEHTTEEYVGYDGTVTTEYTIYNPTDSEITFRAALPFSLIPDYFDGVDVRTSAYPPTVRLARPLDRSFCMASTLSSIRLTDSMT